MTERVTEKISVRPADKGDIEAIIDIWWQLASEHVDRDSEYWALIPEQEARESFRKNIDQSLGSPDHVWVVAENDGKAIGFIHGNIVERPPVMALSVVVKIDEVAVHKDFRERGIGRKMLDSILKELKKRSLTHAYLMVDADNKAAISLYKSTGFYVRQHQLIVKID